MKNKLENCHKIINLSKYIFFISVNRDENLALSIVSIDCSKKGTDEDITIHKVPAMPKGEQPTILKEFQGRLLSLSKEHILILQMDSLR